MISWTSSWRSSAASWPKNHVGDLLCGQGPGKID
jgi:hypothetical protein